MGKKAFGTKLVLVNDVRQVLDPKVFLNGPWIHLATVQRGFKEYMAFKHINGNKVYIEEVDPTQPGLLKKIEDDKEWEDLYRFLLERGCLLISGKDIEIKYAKN